MTVPQFTTITPSDGLASGRETVVVRGVHYREPDPDSAVTDTVSVTFNGVEAEKVVPLAHYVLHVVTPRYFGAPGDLPKAVDVVITNLDDDGEPIPGESVTAAGAFTFRRPRIFRDKNNRLAPRTLLDAVTMELIAALKTGLLPDVAIATDPDFSDDPSSGLVAVADLPAILLSGPSPMLSREFLTHEPTETARADWEDSTAVTVAPLPLSLSWGIVIIADYKHVATNAMSAALDFFDRRPYLRVPTTAARTEYTEAELTHGGFTASDRPADKIYTYEATLMLRPIYLPVDAAIEYPTVFTTEDSEDFLELESTTHE